MYADIASYVKKEAGYNCIPDKMTYLKAYTFHLTCERCSKIFEVITFIVKYLVCVCVKMCPLFVPTLPFVP